MAKPRKQSYYYFVFVDPQGRHYTRAAHGNTIDQAKVAWCYRGKNEWRNITLVGSGLLRPDRKGIYWNIGEKSSILK